MENQTLLNYHMQTNISADMASMQVIIAKFLKCTKMNNLSDNR
jgi:hypothetical protein